MILRAQPPAAPAPRSARPWPTLLAGAAIALLYLWIWSVSAHRIHGKPYPHFAAVFSTGCGDFEHFWFAARALRDGADLYASGVGGYIYPPLVAFAYVPVAALPVKDAAIVMLAVNMALGLACALLASRAVLRRLDLPSDAGPVLQVAAIVMLLAATRLRGEFQMWQTNVPMMAAMLLALVWLDRRPWLAGLALGLAMNIKYLPLVYLPYLLLRRRFAAAGGFVAGAAGFALLPALATGWRANLDNLAVAFAGLARLVGIAVPAQRAANIDPLDTGHSLSVTSGIARMLGPDAPRGAALLLAALVALALLAAIVALYRAHRVPLLRWPPAVQQRSAPWTGLVAVEWMALITFALAFSPQTNPRHTSMLLMTFVPLVAMLRFAPAPAWRRPALLGTAVLWLSFTLPPATPAFQSALTSWRIVSGVGWCMAATLPLLFWAALRFVDRPVQNGASPRAAPDAAH